jgi:hypothetical protein
MNNQNTILGICLILFGVLILIWRIKKLIKGKYSSFGWDAYGIVFGGGLIVCGIILINK